MRGKILRVQAGRDPISDRLLETSNAQGSIVVLRQHFAHGRVGADLEPYVSKEMFVGSGRRVDRSAHIVDQLEEVFVRADVGVRLGEGEEWDEG